LRSCAGDWHRSTGPNLPRLSVLVRTTALDRPNKQHVGAKRTSRIHTSLTLTLAPTS
jgi:hypothetical protein